MATVKAILRRNKKSPNGKCPIRILLSHSGKRVEISLQGVKIDPSKWDSKK